MWLSSSSGSTTNTSKDDHHMCLTADISRRCQTHQTSCAAEKQGCSSRQSEGRGYVCARAKALEAANWCVWGSAGRRLCGDINLTTESGRGSLEMHECPPLAQKSLCVQLLACVKCEAPDHKQAQNTTGSCLMFLLDRIVSTLSLSCRSRIGVLKYNILEHVYGAFEHHPAEILLTLKAFLKICAESRFPPR